MLSAVHVQSIIKLRKSIKYTDFRFAIAHHSSALRMVLPNPPDPPHEDPETKDSAHTILALDNVPTNPTCTSGFRRRQFSHTPSGAHISRSRTAICTIGVFTTAHANHVCSHLVRGRLPLVRSTKTLPTAPATQAYRQRASYKCCEQLPDLSHQATRARRQTSPTYTTHSESSCSRIGAPARGAVLAALIIRSISPSARLPRSLCSRARLQKRMVSSSSQVLQTSLLHSRPPPDICISKCCSRPIAPTLRWHQSCRSRIVANT